MKDRLFKGKRKLITIPLTLMFGLVLLPFVVGGVLCWLIYKKVSNKKVKWISLGLVALFTIFVGSAWMSGLATPSESERESNAPGVVQEAQLTPTAEPQAKITLAPSDRQEVKVTRVVDGDTIELEGGQKLRYIGMDTPETGDCYATEATNKNKELVEGKLVSLEKDVSETDRFGRLLRYVYVDDVMVNEVLVKDGFASVYTYPPDVKYNDRFMEVQKDASAEGRGLWSSCDSSANSSGQLVPTTAPAARTTTSQPTQPSSTSCKYSCSSPDRDCADFSTHAEAQAFFECCGFTAAYDPMRLDKANGQGNGIACESRP